MSEIFLLVCVWLILAGIRTRREEELLRQRDRDVRELESYGHEVAIVRKRGRWCVVVDRHQLSE
jgi:hypothetical protein